MSTFFFSSVCIIISIYLSSKDLQIKKTSTSMIISSRTWGLYMSLISIVLVINLLSLTLVKAQNYRCYNDNCNCTSNSTYSNNLNAVLSSLPSNASTVFGFSNASFGQNPNRANVIALCLPDTKPSECTACVGNATSQLLDLCPNQKEAVLRTDPCMLRYSNESLIGRMDDVPFFRLHNNGNVTSPEQFNRDLRALLSNLQDQAASGGSLMKGAAGNRTTADFLTIYGMSQCTPDISERDCLTCLIVNEQRIQESFPNALGARIFAPSCNLRYETYPFCDITRVQEARAAALGPTPPPPLPSAPPPPPPPPPLGPDVDNTTRNIIIMVVVIAVFLIVVGSIGVFLGRKRGKQKPTENIEFDDDTSRIESLQYDFGKLKAATNDFSEATKLGQGGFAAVYKGTLENGQEIAVKRLFKGSRQGDVEFKNEVLLMAKLQHRNLLRLLGFAIEGPERLLVYEFLENSSLDNFLFDSIKRSYLDWDRRYKIIIGIAKGLLYLHEDSRLRIIHRDLKAANILLDGEMNPKIADFGMARLVTLDQNEGSTSRIMGTYGYMAPEYVMQGHFSVKSDVFSFGALILEIISGQKNSHFQIGKNDENMLSFAWRNWREGTTMNMVDPVLRSSSGSLHDMLRCIHIGLLCVQENVADRPTMASVVLMINSFSITMPVPSQPAFFISSGFSEDIAHLNEHNSRELSLKSSSYNKSVKSTHYSKNEASISDLYPR